MSTTIGVLPRISADELQALGGRELLVLMFAVGGVGEYPLAVFKPISPIAIRKMYLSKSIAGANDDPIDVYLQPALLVTPTPNGTSVTAFANKYGDFGSAQIDANFNVGGVLVAATGPLTSETKYLEIITSVAETREIEFASPLVIVPSAANPGPVVSFMRQRTATSLRVTLEITQFDLPTVPASFPM